MPDKLQSRKKGFFFDFSDRRPYYTLCLCLNTEFYELSNDTYAAMIKKIFLSEFWFQWNILKDITISLIRFKFTDVGFTLTQISLKQFYKMCNDKSLETIFLLCFYQDLIFKRMVAGMSNSVSWCNLLGLQELYWQSTYQLSERYKQLPEI